MKALLIAEYRNGQLQGNYQELISFATRINAEPTLFLVGSEQDLPNFDGQVLLGDVATYGEFNPDSHKQLVLAAVEKIKPEFVVFSHSSYGWDLAPRVACSLGAAQVSEIVDIKDDRFVVPVCNGKLRRKVQSTTPVTVATLQAGAFSASEESTGSPSVEKIDAEKSVTLTFAGYEEAELGGVDLSKADVIVSGGRGIGQAENMGMVSELATLLGGEYGASRPVVDAEWAEHSRQVGTTGQTVSPKLYLACGISGAIQHLAGMKKAEFVVAVNTDKDAPIGEIADVLVVADLKQFIPALIEKLKG